MDQAALQVNADSPASDNVYYLVAMGGGGEEGAFGTINTFNLTAESGVKVSSDLAGCLTGYRFSAVEEGCSVAKLVDVQAAFPSLTFFAPPATSCGYICNTFSCLSNGQSFGFSGGSTVLYAIPNGPPPPASVPGPLPIFGVLCAFQVSRRIRRGIRPANM
jgi:hypothetical protein